MNNEIRFGMKIRSLSFLNRGYVQRLAILRATITQTRMRYKL